jgi:type IV pilus assembly protein PilF
MKAGTCFFVLALLCGCASAPSSSVPPGAPVMDTGTIVNISGPRNRAKLHTELASLYYSRGSMAVALEELRTALAADDDYAPAHGMLGVVYQELRENELAEKSFQRALELAPSDPDINHNYGWYLCQTKRGQKGIKYFMRAVSNPLYTTPWRSYSAAGECAMQMNDLKEAEHYFDRALKLAPNDPPALLHLGQIRYRQGSLDEARKLVARYNRVVSPSAESLWLAVRVERKLGERFAENSFASELRKRFPGSPEYRALQRGDFE